MTKKNSEEEIHTIPSEKRFNFTLNFTDGSRAIFILVFGTAEAAAERMNDYLNNGYIRHEGYKVTHYPARSIFNGVVEVL